MNQLKLFKQPAPVSPQQKSRLAPELLAKMRQEGQTFLLAVNYVNDSRYQRLVDASTEAMKAARAFLTPKRKEAALTIAAATPSKPCKPYRRTSEISRRRRRVTMLLKRIRQKEPLFFFERVQEKIVSNPEYYGACILESERVCSVNPGQRLQWRTTDRAIARENALRRQGE